MITRVKCETVHMGFDISGTVIFGDYEGDSSVPYGTRPMAPYTDDLSIMIDDIELCGTGVLTEDFEDECCTILEEEAIGK